MATENDEETIDNSSEESKETPAFKVKVSGEEDDVKTITDNSNEGSNQKLDNNNTDSEEEEEDQHKEEEEYDLVELDEKTAFDFLKKTKGIEAESFDDLVKPKESKKLTPEVEKFLEFQDRTGNTSYSDFLATQKEWDKEDPDNVLKQLLKIENPTLDNKQIDFLFKRKYSYDADLADEDEVMEKDINKKVDLQKGLLFLEKQKQEYMVNRGSEDNIPEEYKKAKDAWDQLQNEFSQNDLIISQKRNEFISATENLFSKNFEGFKTKIGDEEFVIKPTDLKQTKEAQMDIRNIQAKFFDENEKLIDPAGYHKALYFANNPDEVAKHYFNLGKASMAEQEERESKNIPQTNGIKNASRPTGEKQFTVRVVE